MRLGVAKLWKGMLQILTFNGEIGAGSLRLADPIGDFAKVLSGVVGAYGVDNEAAIHFDGCPRFQSRNFRDQSAFPKPPHRYVARKSGRLA